MIPTIYIGSISISSYNLMIGVGALAMLMCILKRKNRFKLSVLQCVIITLLLTICGIVGAKLLFYLENGFQSGGVSFFGSVFFIPIMMPLIGRLFGLKISQTLDLCAPCIAIMIGMIRIGCFMCGCCGGWVMYIGSIYFTWPTQIMECIGDIIIFVWLIRMENCGKMQNVLYPLFMISYSVMRFCIEFLRYTPDKWFNLGHGQWFALAAIFLSVIWLIKNGEQRFGNFSNHQ